MEATPATVCVLGGEGDAALRAARTAVQGAARPELLTVLAPFAGRVDALRAALERDGVAPARAACVQPAPGAAPAGGGGLVRLHAAGACAARFPGYSGATVVLVADGARPVPGWDDALRRAAVRGAHVLTADAADAAGAPGFPRPLRFEGAAGLAAGVAPFVGACELEAVAATLAACAVVAMPASCAARVCADVCALVGPDAPVGPTQGALVIALAAHRCRAPLLVCTRAVALRARGAAPESVQFVHPHFRYMAGGTDALERRIGVDVGGGNLYGQGLAGITDRATVDESLAKTGMLVGELRGAAAGAFDIVGHGG